MAHLNHQTVKGPNSQIIWESWDQHDRIRREAKERGMNVSSMVRMAVEEWLRNNPQVRPSKLHIYQSINGAWYIVDSQIADDPYGPYSSKAEAERAKAAFTPLTSSASEG